MGHKQSHSAKTDSAKTEAAAANQNSTAPKGVPCGQSAAVAKPTLPKPTQGWQLPPRYEVKKIIGKGSYGSVCQARDNKENRDVAIKQLKNLFDDLVDCKRILRELAILARLDSNHCVRIHDIVISRDFSTFDELYIVLEICDTDMKKLVRTDVNLSTVMVTTLLYNLLVGLKYIHSAGIYHRDLKPANCLVNQNCQVKICDFGLARAIGGEQGRNVDSMAGFRDQESDEELVGAAPRPIVPSTLKRKRYLTQHVVTRWYRAPEIILLQTGYNEAIDIWSVGCIYAELLQTADQELRLADRGPLFPGSSCLPLSPDRRNRGGGSKRRTQHDQLEVIFNIIGTPSEADISCLDSEDARKYVRGFEKRQGEGLSKQFEKAEPQSLDLIERMLRFNAKERITVMQALEHPQVKSVRTPEAEELAPDLVALSFEKEGDKLSEEQLKKYFREEHERFHSED